MPNILLGPVWGLQRVPGQTIEEVNYPGNPSQLTTVDQQHSSYSS